MRCRVVCTAGVSGAIDRGGDGGQLVGGGVQHREGLKPGCGSGSGTLGQRLGDAAAVILAHWLNRSASLDDQLLDRLAVALQPGEAAADPGGVAASLIALEDNRRGLALKRLAAVAQLGQSGLCGDVLGGLRNVGGDGGRARRRQLWRIAGTAGEGEDGCGFHAAIIRARHWPR